MIDKKFGFVEGHKWFDDPKEPLLRHWMLLPPFKSFVIKRIKDPLRKLLIIIAKRLPEPTKENCVQHNTHIILDYVERVRKYHNNTGRQEFVDSSLKGFACLNEHDPYYSWIVNDFMEYAQERGWKYNQEGFPLPDCWREGV